jgi:hypothetical protein
MMFPNGDVYDGEWANGKRHGMGLFKAQGGSTYAGSWDNGKRHGHGVLTNVGAGQSEYQTKHVSNSNTHSLVINSLSGRVVSALCAHQAGLFSPMRRSSPAPQFLIVHSTGSLISFPIRYAPNLSRVILI